MKIMHHARSRGSCTRAAVPVLYQYDDAAAWHLPAKFMVLIRLYGEIEVMTEMELGPAQNIRYQVCIYYYGFG